MTSDDKWWGGGGGRGSGRGVKDALPYFIEFVFNNQFYY